MFVHRDTQIINITVTSDEFTLNPGGAYMILAILDLDNSAVGERTFDLSAIAIQVQQQFPTSYEPIINYFMTRWKSSNDFPYQLNLGESSDANNRAYYLGSNTFNYVELTGVTNAPTTAKVLIERFTEVGN